MFKHLVTVLASSALLTSGAMAQEVQSSKEAPAKTLLPNAYGLMSVRSYQKVRYDNNAQGQDEYAGTSPYGQARLTLGSTWFEGKLDTSATLFVEKSTGTTQVDTLAPELIADYKPLSNENGYVKTYGDWYPAFHNQPSQGQFGVETGVMAPIATGIGLLTFSGELDVSTWLVGGKETSAVGGDTTQPGLSLAPDEEGNYSTMTADQSLLTLYGAKAALELGAVPGLSTYALVEFNRKFAPNYVADAEESDSKKLNGYTAASFTETSLDVSYKVNETVTLSNTVFNRTNGFYQKSYDVASVEADKPSGTESFRWMNRLMLTATLF